MFPRATSGATCTTATTSIRRSNVVLFMITKAAAARGTSGRRMGVGRSFISGEVFESSPHSFLGAAHAFPEHPALPLAPAPAEHLGPQAAAADQCPARSVVAA